jgi:hypothetical protein
MDSLITHFRPGLSEPSLIAGEVVEGFEKSLASALAELRLVVAADPSCRACSCLVWAVEPPSGGDFTACGSGTGTTGAGTAAAAGWDGTEAV